MGLNVYETTDERGRPVRPVVFNTAKDGSGAWYFPMVDSDGRLTLVEYFGGATYENQGTASVDTARRFETISKKLRDVLIRVSTYAQYFGDSSNQRMEVGAGDYMWITKIDISTLYFKNKTAGENGVVTILGVEE